MLGSKMVVVVGALILVKLVGGVVHLWQVFCLMSGVRVRDESVVAAGVVVAKDVPKNSIVTGNPAKIIRSGIKAIKWGRIVS